jgi:RNA polymerase sigma factor (sigma-70 family)
MSTPMPKCLCSASVLSISGNAEHGIISSAEPAVPRLPSSERALSPLYVRHWAELCSYLKRTFGPGPPDPQDVVQQAFLRYAALGVSDNVQNARAYLYRIAHNVFVEEHRRVVVNRKAVARLSIRDGSGVDEVTPERVLLAKERLQVLRTVIRAQPCARRTSFLLNRLEGLSCAEIARRTGYSESAVKKHITLVMADVEAAVTCVETGKSSLNGAKIVNGRSSANR